jgi:O-antigen/teichoic acid export membrane protein
MDNSTISANNKRIAKNTLMLYIRMGITLLVGLYTSRVILEVLGIEDYGIYNVVGGVVTLFSFFSTSMQSAIERFLAFELGKNNRRKYNEIFNCSLIVFGGIMILVILFAETIGLWIVQNKLNISPERLDIVNFVYQISIGTTCISIMRIPYLAGILSQEKMSFFAIMSIFETILKLLLVYMLIFMSADKLILYSILIFVLTILTNLGYTIYCRKNIDLYKWHLCLDSVLYKKIISFSGWRLLGASSQMAEKQGINIILNLFFGTVVNAANGIANQVNAAVSSLIAGFQQSFHPQITKYYALGEYQPLNKLVNFSAKISFLLLSFFIIPLVYNIDYVLNIWLKEVPQYTSGFCILVLLNTLLETYNAPLWMTILATGKIAHYQIVLSILTYLSFGAACLLLFLGYEPVSVLLAKIVLTCFLILYRLYLLRNVIKNRIKFIKSAILKPCVVVLISFCTLYLLFGDITGFYRLSITLLYIIFLYPCVLYWVVLENSEKLWVRKSLKRLFTTSNI